MDEMTLSQQRAEVIEKFINIEIVVNAIICQHYFGCLRKEFFLEVLYDEYCTFALKRRILEKIVPNVDKKQIQSLNRLSTIRNYFAHIGLELFKVKEGVPQKGQVGIVPDPRELDEAVDFSELYKEFKDIEPTLAKYLFCEVFEKMGGKLLKG